MTNLTYEVVNLEPYAEQQVKRTDADGTVWFIPLDLSNSDYQAYLNPVEHLTEIPTV